MSDDDLTDSEEEELLEKLRDAGALDPVPVEALAAAMSSFAWRTMDAELAELSYDSAVEDERMAGVRGGAGGARMLTFESGPICVEVEAHEEGGLRRLIGQVVPVAEGEVDVRHAGGTATVAVDTVGRFVVDGVAAGTVRLRWRPATGEGGLVTLSVVV